MSPNVEFRLSDLPPAPAVLKPPGNPTGQDHHRAQRRRHRRKHAERQPGESPDDDSSTPSCYSSRRGTSAMALSLSPEVQKLIEERMKRGGYPTADDVVRTALGFLDVHTRELDEETVAAIEEGEAADRPGGGPTLGGVAGGTSGEISSQVARSMPDRYPIIYSPRASSELHAIFRHIEYRTGPSPEWRLPHRAVDRRDRLARPVPVPIPGCTRDEKQARRDA